MLVIDDDRSTLELYREILEEEGYAVTAAVSPDLEPAAVTNLAPDLILLDLLFAHERRGVTFLEALKAHPATLPVPVLVCSADTRLLDELHDRLVAWDCGVLAKPFGLDELLAAIQDCLTPSTRATIPRDLPLTSTDIPDRIGTTTSNRARLPAAG